MSGSDQGRRAISGRRAAVSLEPLGLMVNPLTRELLPMRLMLAGAIL